MAVVNTGLWIAWGSFQAEGNHTFICWPRKWKKATSFENSISSVLLDWGQEVKGETEDEMVSWRHWLKACYCCSVAESCPTLCDPWTACSTLGFPVLHRLLEYAQNSCLLSQWCLLTISSSVVPISSCLQSSPASGSFLMSQLFVSGAVDMSLSNVRERVKEREAWCPAVHGVTKSLIQLSGWTTTSVLFNFIFSYAPVELPPLGS